MFLFLLFATFVAASAVSFAVMWLFTKPIDRVLQRIIADEVSSAWSKYMKFAIMVVGVSEGVQLRDLERYINPTVGGREVQTATWPGFDRWIFELYRAAIDTLQGIAWLLLVFFVFALIAYVIVRIGEMRSEQVSSGDVPPAST
jgi:hypothetical protein